jgi:uncharacterized membrane protein YgcG
LNREVLVPQFILTSKYVCWMVEDVMLKARLIHVLGLSLVLGAASSTDAATPGVRDAANMFSGRAIRQADEQLTDIHRKHGWEIVFETIDTLEGKSIDRATEDKARSLQVRGVYFLVAKREHKIHYWIERPAIATFDKATIESVTQTVIGRFKQQQYDDALQKAVGALGEAADRGPSAPGEKPLARSAPATSRPELAPPPTRDAERNGSFLGTALVIGAVIVVILVLVRVIGAMMRRASGGGPGYGSGGGPGYGMGGGGGFFGNVMAGIGGALLGNYLYNSFFGGGQARASEQFGESASANPAAFDDQGVSGGDGWGDGASAEDGGNDTGGDDFGGGDVGGGDFGGGGDF